MKAVYAALVASAILSFGVVNAFGQAETAQIKVGLDIKLEAGKPELSWKSAKPPSPPAWERASNEVYRLSMHAELSRLRGGLRPL
jgi:hypothetical protein